MRLQINRDYFDNPQPPRIFLCNTSTKIIGELQTYAASMTAKWNAYSELRFSVDRVYIDNITGDAIVNSLFDKIAPPRNVYVEGIGYFTLQDIDDEYEDKDSKTVSAFSLEYGCGSKYLSYFKINTGDVDSKEVLYNESIYGVDYSMDSLYQRATGNYDAYEKYYIQEYTDNDSYIWTQVEVRDATVYETYDGTTIAKTLWVKNYKNIQFYNQNNTKLSLLHYIFEQIPEWSIGHVDTSLWHQERMFDESRVDVYSFLMNTVADTFKCVVSWDILNRTVNFYEEADDGITEDNTIQSMFDSDVYISRDNLASAVHVKYSMDNIKTKLKVSGRDDISIREVNLGKDYLINLDFYHNPEWMEQDLYEAYDDYLDAVETYSPLYTSAMQGWLSAYNQYDNLMNAVPVEGNVVLVGDKFQKLYCIYGADNTTDNISANLISLTDKLNLYKVYEDSRGTNKDNVLLTLKNSNGDRATIRIYDPHQVASSTFNPNIKYFTRSGNSAATYKYTMLYITTAEQFNSYSGQTLYTNNYKIQCTIVRSTGIVDTPSEYDLSSWIRGHLTVDNIGYDGMSNLSGFKVASIGTMGAYLVLAKDEKQVENINDYGVGLLKTKLDTYTQIFQTQTTAMWSQENSRCIASDTEPQGDLPEGTKWFKTDENILYVRTDQPSSSSFILRWAHEDMSASSIDYMNYQNYMDNYEKMQAVQTVLSKKEQEAQYCLSGYPVENRRIDVNSQTLESDMRSIAVSYFSGHTVSRVSFNSTYPLYTFATSFDASHNFAVYLRGNIPYIAYATSQGVYQTIMDYYSELTELKNFFTAEQWARLSPFIREDEYSNENVILNGLESEEERYEIYGELVELAAKELKSLSQPSLEFSMDMSNILAIPEFAQITSQFALGNFIRIELMPGIIKRSRLLEVNLNFDDLNDFSCSFGNLVNITDPVDLHAELLSQAIQAGKTVSASAGEWQKAVDKTNELESSIANGLRDATLYIQNASGQIIEIGKNGLIGRKLVDGTTDTYEDEQVALINNKLCFTSDNWQTSKAVFGKFTIKDSNGNDVDRWGLLSDAVVSGYISGSVIEGGHLEIGGPKGKFIVNEDGSVEILGPDDNNLYASKVDVEVLQDARKYHVDIQYSGSTVFSEPNSSCTLTAHIYSWDEDITQQAMTAGATFSWIRNSKVNDIPWNEDHANLDSNTLIIRNSDVSGNAQFSVKVTLDDEHLIISSNND